MIGWDSPTDFLWDVGLFVVTGGASKVVRWGKRVFEVTKKAGKALSKLEKLLEIGKRARRMEARLLDVKRAAERLRKAKNMLRLPLKIRDAFKILNTAREALKIEEMVASTVTTQYIRNVASSFVSKSTGLGGSPHAGGTLSKELAMASIMAYLDGTPLGKQIRELRGQINYTLIIASGFDSKNQEQLMLYFGFHLTRQFLARSTVAFLHKRTLTAALFVDAFIESGAAALEAMLLDVPFVSEAKLKELGRIIIATIRKILVEIGKNLARKLIAA